MLLNETDRIIAEYGELYNYHKCIFQDNMYFSNKPLSFTDPFFDANIKSLLGSISLMYLPSLTTGSTFSIFFSPPSFSGNIGTFNS